MTHPSTTRRNALRALAGASAAALAAPHIASADGHATTWKIQTSHTGGIGLQTFKDWCATIEEKTGGELAFQAFGANDVVGDFQLYDAVKNGVLDAVNPFTIYAQGIIPAATMRDLAILAQRLIEDFPEYYPMFAETEFEFDGRAPSNTQNRNPILRLGIGADGLKTGHTREAGYGLVGSAIQGNRRVIFAFTGLDTARARAQEAEAIVNWSMRHFEARLLAPAGQPIAHADIWMGKQPQVSLMPAEDLTVLLPVLMDKTVTAEVEYRGPIQAPVAAGDHLADLVVQPENLPEIRLPLVASQDVPVGGFMVRVGTAAQVLMRQFLAPSAS